MIVHGRLAYQGYSRPTGGMNGAMQLSIASASWRLRGGSSLSMASRQSACTRLLCMDLLQERQERFVEEITVLLTATATSPALERLDGVLTHVVALLEEQGALLMPLAGIDARYGLCGESDNSRRISLQHAGYFLWLQELIAGLLAEAVERGELGALDVPYTTDAILATLHPMFYHFQRQERGFSQGRILQGLRRIYIDGVKMQRNTDELADI